MLLDEIISESHRRSAEAGWWNDPISGEPLVSMLSDSEFPYVIATKICLIHSEVSEALEGYRRRAMDDKLPHRSALEVELADTIIRIGDLAGMLGLDLVGAIKEKFEFNAVRPDHKTENRVLKSGKRF